MKTWIKNSLFAALGAAMLAGSVQAQPRMDDRGRDHRAAPHEARPAPHRAPAPQAQRHDRDVRGPQARSYQHHEFRRGERLPSNYRSNHYVVDNWRTHGLKAPPRGQHWVQVGGDYLLVSIATGVIASVLLGGR
jgi:Ni/Co efflux regulator RcnB